MQAIAESHAIEHGACPIGGRRVTRAPALELEGEHDVLERCQAGQQMKVLENKAHTPGPQPRPAVFAERCQVRAE